MALYQPLPSYFHSNVHSKPQSDWEAPQIWQDADTEQRTLDNALVLWQRFVEENRRDVVCTRYCTCTASQAHAMSSFTGVRHERTSMTASLICHCRTSTQSSCAQLRSWQRWSRALTSWPSSSLALRPAPRTLGCCCALASQTPSRCALLGGATRGSRMRGRLIASFPLHCSYCLWTNMVLPDTSMVQGNCCCRWRSTRAA